MGTANLMLGVEILLVASFYKNRDNLRLDGPQLAGLHYSIWVQPQELRFPYLQILFCPLWPKFPTISRIIFVVKTWT